MKLYKNTQVDLLFPVYSGLVVSFVISVLVLLNIINYGSDYDAKIILTVIIIGSAEKMPFQNPAEFSNRNSYGTSLEM